MNKILIFVANLLVCIGVANAGVRDGTTVSRTKSDKNTVQSQGRISTTVRRSTTPRTTALVPRTAKGTTVARSGASVSSRSSSATVSRSATPAQRTVSRNATTNKNAGRVVSRAANTPATTAMSSTRTGAEYEQCKNTYFSCMDQFCSLKNDDYRRCSCNDRVFKLIDARKTLQQAGEQLTVFTENLDVVGMTAAQATAMRTESEGEAALTDDKSASKALLQAIMNSIRGEDSTVGGKYTDLNSINISFDTANAFGMTDVGQAIAAYNGMALYNAVYPQCRDAVRSDCNDASLQRAITAYLMAIEQDCNTVQTAIEKTQQQMKSAVREGGAMLDLARIENRQKHNSADVTTCINAVESAILSEEVCGANYHKCLDNGEYIDVTTGKPIAGIKDFYKLENLLSFSDGVDIAEQRLSKDINNRAFVTNFENRVKKFAAPALDTCVEKADTVWSEYLDRAMLSIYYAQKSKVAEIKQGCIDFVSACYMDSDAAITAGMSGLTGDNTVILQPDKIALSSAMCTDYVASCNNMFANNGEGDIIAQYVKNRTDTDTLTACRAIARQCFDKYGGANYENFYYPYSGLFEPGTAIDWFTLYEYDTTGNRTMKSECAKILTTVDACNNDTLIAQVFGGFDSVPGQNNGLNQTTGDKIYYFKNNMSGKTYYGLLDDKTTDVNLVDDTTANDVLVLQHRTPRSSGVATEVYNQVMANLSTQCMNLNGRFVGLDFARLDAYIETDYCQSDFDDYDYYSGNDNYKSLINAYRILENENMCPRDYGLGVDTQSWGACLCWENGARRSKDGKSASCLPVVPVLSEKKDAKCNKDDFSTSTSETETPETDWDKTDWYKTDWAETKWCSLNVDLLTGLVCPFDEEDEEDEEVVNDGIVPYCDGYKNVPDAITTNSLSD